MHGSGRRFGRYRSIRLIDEGGFAYVYKAWDPRLRIRVAIKVLKKELAQHDHTTLLSEARTLARLNHPHIIRIIDLGIYNNMPYLVMTYAPNGSLRQRHPYGNVLSLDTIVDYVWQVSDALSYLHSQGIVHQDVKPENLLLGLDNEILLTDFGIAKLIRNTASHEMRNIIGTVTHMAPERFYGESCPASDQYSIAVMVCEWLTGEALFHGSTKEIINQHFDIPALNRRLDTLGVPRPIKQVLLKALALEPEDRFENVQAFAFALDQARASVLDQANLEERENIWYDATLTFAIASFSSIIAGFFTYVARFGLNAALLVTSGVLMLISLPGCFLKRNYVGMRLVVGSTTIAGLIGLTFDSYGVFCLILLILFFFCSIVGLVVGFVLSRGRC